MPLPFTVWEMTAGASFWARFQEGLQKGKRPSHTSVQGIVDLPKSWLYRLKTQGRGLMLSLGSHIVLQDVSGICNKDTEGIFSPDVLPFFVLHNTLFN